MGREIRQMIAKQKQVRDDTAAVAEKRYKEKKDTAMEGRLLAGEQSAIDKAAQRLAQTVDEALKAQAEPQDRGAYEDVQQAMADGKLAEHLRSATQEAAAQNYLSAMQHQEQALKALEAMAAASDAVPDANAADAIERLEQLRDKLADALRKQEQLTAKTDQTPGDALMRQAPALKGEQAGLREQVKDIDPSQFRAEQPAPQPTATPEAAGIRELAEQQKQLTQDTAARDAAGQDVQQLQPTQDGLARKAGELADAASTPEVKSALRQAQAEMQKSSQALASNQPQQAAEPQKLAQQALAQALQQAENAANPQQQPSAADQPQNPIASALDQMQKATDALAKPEQPEAVQHQR